ncbi:MAG TPA: hypothetical protein VFM61_03265 [Pseudidiomarina sp.]|nr:hypothetical protein [Pseudidiomarina sp.]
MSGTHCVFVLMRTNLQDAAVWGVQIEHRQWLRLSTPGGKPSKPWHAEGHSWCIANWAFIRLYRVMHGNIESRWLCISRTAVGRQQWHRLRRLLLLWREDRGT